MTDNEVIKQETHPQGMKCLCPGVFMTFSLMRAYIIFNPFELARLLTYHIIWGQSVLPASV